MNHSTPGLPVHYQHPEFTQTHAHRVSDAIQPSHSLLSPSPSAPNPSQYQGLFQWVNSSHEVAKVLEFQLQHQSFQWTPRIDLLQDGLVGFPCSPRDSHYSPKLSFWCVLSIYGLPWWLSDNLLVMPETWVQFLGWEDPLEEGMATHSSTLAWGSPWAEEPGSYRP